MFNIWTTNGTDPSPDFFVLIYGTSQTTISFTTNFLLFSFLCGDPSALLITGVTNLRLINRSGFGNQRRNPSVILFMEQQ
jgi:hypothetical protein